MSDPRVAFRFVGVGVLLLASGCPGSLPDDVLSQLGPDAGGSSRDSGAGGMDAGTGGTGGDAGDVDVCPDAPGEVFAGSCLSGCHTADARLGMLDLESPDFADRLVGAESSVDACAGEILVQPSDPEASLLLKKLGDDADALCAGALMPLGRQDSFPEDDYRLVREWIAAGAPDCDDVPTGDAGAGASADGGMPGLDAGSGALQPGDPLPRDAWRISASVSDAEEVPENAIDGDAATPWGTGEPQMAGQWLQIDLGESRTFQEIEMDHGSRAQSDYPRSYEVYVGDDPSAFGPPVATGSGRPGEATVIALDQEATGRYIRIEQLETITDAGGNWWSVYEVIVRR